MVVGLYHEGGGGLAGAQAGERLSLGNPNVGGVMLGFRRPLRSLVWSVARVNKESSDKRGELNDGQSMEWAMQRVYKPWAT